MKQITFALDVRQGSKTVLAALKYGFWSTPINGHPQTGLDIDLAPDLPVGVIGHADPARFCCTFKTSSNVDAVAKDVVVIVMMLPT